MIDISDPSNPAEVGWYNTPSWGYGIFASGKYAYVADGVCGLQIYENLHTPSGIEERPAIRGPQELFLLQNPVINEIKIGFNHRYDEDVTFTLFNIVGQKVLSFEKRLSSGHQEVKIPVKGVVSGIYFLKVGAGSHACNIKVTVVQ